MKTLHEFNTIAKCLNELLKKMQANNIIFAAHPYYNNSNDTFVPAFEMYIKNFNVDRPNQFESFVRWIDTNDLYGLPNESLYGCGLDKVCNIIIRYVALQPTGLYKYGSVCLSQSDMDFLHLFANMQFSSPEELQIKIDLLGF